MKNIPSKNPSDDRSTSILTKSVLSLSADGVYMLIKAVLRLFNNQNEKNNEFGRSDDYRNICSKHHHHDCTGNGNDSSKEKEGVDMDQNDFNDNLNTDHSNKDTDNKDDLHDTTEGMNINQNTEISSSLDSRIDINTDKATTVCDVIINTVQVGSTGIIQSDGNKNNDDRIVTVSNLNSDKPEYLGTDKNLGTDENPDKNSGMDENPDTDENPDKDSCPVIKFPLSVKLGALGHACHEGGAAVVNATYKEKVNLLFIIFDAYQFIGIYMYV
jgi:hypothetical protein